MEKNFERPQVALPNATVILVLGIVSIVTCCCYGIVGVVCSIIALILAGKAKDLYEASPEQFTAGSYKNVKAGKICAVTGLIFSILCIIYFIGIIVLIGWEALQNPELMQERIQDLFIQ
ncbi:hypothetical protein FACS189413_19880 [Bacteroidia bacterium]|nr:hypothetical protein FACS189413_19880 [Bacteroidia bacterium]